MDGWVDGQMDKQINKSMKVILLKEKQTIFSKITTDFQIAKIAKRQFSGLIMPDLSGTLDTTEYCLLLEISLVFRL